MNRVAILSILAGIIVVVCVGMNTVNKYLNVKRAKSIEYSKTIKKKMPIIPNVILSERTSVSKSQQVKSETQSLETTKISVDELNKVKVYAEEFNLPNDLKEELLAAARNPIEGSDSGDTKDTEEIPDKEVIFTHLIHFAENSKDNPVTAGHNLPEGISDEIIASSLPVETSRDEASQTIDGDSTDEKIEGLKSEALATIGFLAMTEFNYGLAKKAFSTLLKYYPDSDQAPMVRLEFARLLLEEGQINKARDIVNEAIYLYREDKEYVQIAKDLREEIKNYE